MQATFNFQKIQTKLLNNTINYLKYEMSIKKYIDSFPVEIDDPHYTKTITYFNEMLSKELSLSNRSLDKAFSLNVKKEAFIKVLLFITLRDLERFTEVIKGYDYSILDIKKRLYRLSIVFYNLIAYIHHSSLQSKIKPDLLAIFTQEKTKYQLYSIIKLYRDFRFRKEEIGFKACKITSIPKYKYYYENIIQSLDEIYDMPANSALRFFVHLFREHILLNSLVIQDK